MYPMGQAKLGLTVRPPGRDHTKQPPFRRLFRHVAIAEGLTMQAVAGGEGGPDPDLLVWIIMFILPKMTRRIGNQNDLEAVFV